MAKFKVGDKVRINDVDRITFGDLFWRNGDVTEVIEVNDDGDILVKVTRGIFREEAFLIAKREFNYIEKAAETPPKLTKNQRIKALEQAQARLETEVAALKRRIEALEQGKSYTHTPRLSVKEVEPVSANRKRKAIIDEAKEFIDEVATNFYGRKLYDVGHYMCSVNFIVNKEKRVVTALLEYNPPAYVDLGLRKEVKAKGIAKCAPGDVFNADIGKAIALGRALGLDVSKFEQAVQPTEVVVGMIVKAKPESFFDDTPYTVEKIEDDRLYDKPGNGWIYDNMAIILDDTEAQY